MTYRHNRPQTQEINFGAADEVQKTQQQQQQPGDTISNADGFSTAGVSSISTPTLALPQLNAEVSGTLAQLLSTICAIEEVQRNAEVAEAESLEVQTGSLTNSMMDTAQLTLNVTCQEIQNTMYQLEIQKVSNVMTIVMDVIAIAIAIAMLVAAVFSGGTTAAIAAAAIAFVATGTMCGISIATVVSGTSPFAQGSALYDSAYNASYASASANEDDDIADKMSSDSSLSYSQAKSLVEGGYRESASASASSVCEGWGIGVMVFLAICTLGSGVAGAASLGSTAMSTTATALMVTSSVLMTASQIMGSLASFNILANAMNAASGGELYEGTSAQKQELNQQLTDTVQDLAIAAAAVAVTAMVVGIAGGAQGEGSESI